VTFRDDHDAALARISSLEHDNEALRGECETLRADNKRLAAENAELRAKVPKREPRVKPPPSERKRRIINIVKGVAIALVIIGTIAIPAIVQHYREKAYEAEKREHGRHALRWKGLIGLDDCLRDSTYAVGQLAGLDAAKTDPRAGGQSFSTNRLGMRCVDKLEALREVDGIGGPIGRWQDAGRALAAPIDALATYYEKGDYKDDNYAAAPGHWALARPKLDAYAAAIEEVWKALPQARAAMRAMQADYAKRAGQTDVWWRIELGYLWNDLVNAEARKRPAAEIVKLASELAQKIPSAPVDVRRDLRSLAEGLERIIAGDIDHVRQLYDNSLWSKTDNEGAGPIPTPPEDPSCGDGGAV